MKQSNHAVYAALIAAFATIVAALISIFPWLYEHFQAHHSETTEDVAMVDSGLSETGNALQEEDVSSNSERGLHLLELGKSCYYGENYKDALTYFELASEYDNAEALYYLGEMYYHELGVELDNPKCLQYYIAAADLGHADAAFTAGFMYYGNLIDIDVDYKAAAYYFMKAIDLGSTYSSSAYRYMGYMYHFGQGVYPDYNVALKYYNESVKLGDTSALTSLAEIYESGGYGVDQNYEKALEYYRKALESNDGFINEEWLEEEIANLLEKTG